MAGSGLAPHDASLDTKSCRITRVSLGCMLNTDQGFWLDIAISLEDDSKSHSNFSSYGP